MATRANETKDGKKNKSVATKTSKNQHGDGDVLLNQDIFWHMFDFLRFDALITCKLLSKDVNRRACQRMMNDGKVWQVNTSLDFLFVHFFSSAITIASLIVDSLLKTHAAWKSE